MSVGDVVQLDQAEDDKEWWQGRGPTGDSGHFPKAFVELLVETDPEPEPEPERKFRRAEQTLAEFEKHAEDKTSPHYRRLQREKRARAGRWGLECAGRGLEARGAQ